MKTCNYCGGDNPDDAPRCHDCGKEMGDPVPTTNKKPWRWVRGWLAIFLGLIPIALAPGSAGRIVADHSTTLPTHHIVGQFRDILMIIGYVLLSLAFLFFGMRKHWALEIVGWVMLVAPYIFAAIVLS